MKRLILSLCFLGVLQGFAQTPSSFPYSKPLNNDPSTGTTQFTLTSINSSGNAVIMPHTVTAGYSGIAVSNAGTTGSVWVAFAGLVPVKMDGTATVDHYVTISTTTDGLGHDTAATTYPTSGLVVGRVQAGCTGANCFAMVDLFGPEVQASSASGSVVVEKDVIKPSQAVGSASYACCGNVTNPSGSFNDGSNPAGSSQFMRWTTAGDQIVYPFIFPAGVTNVALVTTGHVFDPAPAHTVQLTAAIGCQHPGSTWDGWSLNTSANSNSVTTTSSTTTAATLSIASIPYGSCVANDEAFLKLTFSGTLPSGSSAGYDTSAGVMQITRTLP